MRRLAWGQGQRLWSHRWRYVGAIYEGLWGHSGRLWGRISLSWTGDSWGQLWWLTCHFWRKIEIILCMIHAESYLELINMHLHRLFIFISYVLIKKPWALQYSRYFLDSAHVILWLTGCVATLLCFQTTKNGLELTLIGTTLKEKIFTCRHWVLPSSCTTESDRELSSDVPRSESQTKHFNICEVSNNTCLQTYENKIKTH